MPGDHTRRTFDPMHDRVGVYQQQGRVTVDADLNELVDLLDRRLRATVADVLGPSLDVRRVVVPTDTPDGFHVTIDGTSLAIGPGRGYVHGIQVDNHGGDPIAFDPTLDELRGTGTIAYDAQPYLPAPPSVPATGTHLVYLDVWHRERTWAEEPDQLDPALYGIDTATRRQVVWQVKVLEDVGDDVRCATPDADVPGWEALLAPTPSRLSTAAVAVPSSDDPCEVPASGGYRGAENRLYRVQVHTGGPLGTATFVWSRDNASVASPVRTIVGAVLTVARTRRDAVLRFSPSDWVEVLDEERELAGQAGELALVLAVDDSTGEITLTEPLAGTFVTDVRVRKWSQTLDADGLPLETTGAGKGALVIDGSPVTLEDGVQVTFGLDGGTAFTTGDHWVFATRTADASVEELHAAPPLGPHHHRARLAVVNLATGVQDDCRRSWPPVDTGGGCDCDACVTPASHASGALTIQRAVDATKDKGGTVCLAPGTYVLAAPVRVQRARGLRIHGRGPSTIIVAPPNQAAFAVDGVAGVTIEDLTVVGAADSEAPATGLGGLGGRSAISIRNAVGMSLRRCILAIDPLRGDDQLPTVAVHGIVVGLDVSDCTVVGAVGVGNTPVAESTGGSAAAKKAAALAMAQARVLLVRATVHDNVIVAGRRGISFTGPAVHALDTRIRGNTVVGIEGGIALLGLALPGASTDVLSNHIITPGTGITAGLDRTRVTGNDILGTVSVGGGSSALAALLGGDALASAWSADLGGSGKAGGTLLTAGSPTTDGTAQTITARLQARAGILLTNGYLLDPRLDGCQVTGNRVSGTRGPGIAVLARVSAVEVSGNQVGGARVAGIAIEATSGGTATVVGNQVTATVGSGNDDVVAAILVDGVLDAQVRDNAVGLVSHRTASLVAGIVLDGVGSAAIHGNSVLGAGAQQGEVAAAVAVLGNLDQAEITGNRLWRGPSQAAKSFWHAVMVTPESIGSSGGKQSFGTKETAFTIQDGATKAVPTGRGLVSVRANVAEGSGPGAVLSVKAAGHLTIADNRCIGDDGAGAAAPIMAAATSAIISGNYVDGGGSRPAVEVAVPAARCTVTGNVATGPYEVGGAPLAAPWSELNVVIPPS